MREHQHYCKFRRHLWKCQHSVRGWCVWPQTWECPECMGRQVAVSSIIIPVVCERCGVQKRNADGQMMYVALSWKRGKRIVCPDCHEGEKTMDQLSRLTGADEESLEDSWGDMLQ